MLVFRELAAARVGGHRTYSHVLASTWLISLQIRKISIAAVQLAQ